MVDSTPVECGRSRETAKRSELSGFADYGYCASHSRYFWGLRLHLVHDAGRAADHLRPLEPQARPARRTPGPLGRARVPARLDHPGGQPRLGEPGQRQPGRGHAGHEGLQQSRRPGTVLDPRTDHRRGVPKPYGRYQRVRYDVPLHRPEAALALRGLQRFDRYASGWDRLQRRMVASGGQVVLAAMQPPIRPRTRRPGSAPSSQTFLADHGGFHLVDSTLHGGLTYCGTGSTCTGTTSVRRIMPVAPVPTGPDCTNTIGLPKLCTAVLRPAMRGEDQRPGARFLKPLRQVIESVNDTLKGQLDLERHGGRTKAGVVVRVLQRLLALTAVIWRPVRPRAPWRPNEGRSRRTGAATPARPDRSHLAQRPRRCPAPPVAARL